jgi:cysteine-rich repeat protein
MFTKIGKASVLFAGVAFAACSSSPKQQGATTGAVGFDLALPDGRTVNTINLNIKCPDSLVDQDHVLNVTNGTAVASFGGLAPGACTVTLASQTADGYKCNGTSMFTIISGQKISVDVTLTCQGTNPNTDGNAIIKPKFVTRACLADRIQKVFAIPSNLLLGESTLAEVELNAANVVGTPTFQWAVKSAPATAQGTLAAGTCSPTSQSCQTFTCTGVGSSPTVDPSTGLPTAGVYVTVMVEDSECFDTEEVWVECAQKSVCGDNTKEGTEECDDGNTTSGDGCSATCVREFCGDNIVQAGLGEVCDGLVGVGANQSCAADCKSIITAAFCGDGIVNQAAEQCDGTAGLQPGQVCTAPPLPAGCKIDPRCGNNIKEGTEECDGTDVASGRTCSPTCTLVAQANPCDTCIAALPDVGTYNQTQCQPDALCAAALDCVLDNSSCWTAIAPAACYCGDTQANIDQCENPTFVPQGRCATALKAGGGAGATNAEVLSRYFDPGFATGNATIIVDAAFTGGCRTQCF